MRLVDGSATMVVAGSWNPAILTPAWVAKYALGIEGDVPLTIKGPTQQIGAPSNVQQTFGLPAFNYSVGPLALVMSGASNAKDDLDRVQQIANRILELLPHTPVAALGFNAQFVADDNDAQMGTFRDAQTALVDAAPDGWGVESNQIIVTLSKDGGQMNVERSLTGEKALIRFNFHFPADSVEEARAILGRTSFFDSLELAKGIASQIASEEFTDD